MANTSLFFPFLLNEARTSEFYRSDEIHAEYPMVIKEGSTYRMWYSGFSPHGGWRIHYATSTDGVNWIKHGVQLESGASDDWDCCSVAYPVVIKNDDGYSMFYGGLGWFDGKYIYQVGLATSTDGEHWAKYDGNPILQKGEPGSWDDIGLLRQSVIRDDSAPESELYKMWYAGVGTGRERSVNYATSADGKNWTKFEGNPLLDRDPNTVWVIKDADNYKMWYGGVFLATSVDGVLWSIYPDRVMAPGPAGSWDQFAKYSGAVLRDGDVYKMWFNGIRSNGGDYGQIGYATSRDGIVWSEWPANPVLPVGFTPTGLDARVNGTGIALTWRPVDLLNLNGYRVYYGSNSFNYQNYVEANGNFAEVRGLRLGEAYFAAAMAIDSSGEGSWFSNEIVATPSYDGCECAVQLALTDNRDIAEDQRWNNVEAITFPDGAPDTEAGKQFSDTVAMLVNGQDHEVVLWSGEWGHHRKTMLFTLQEPVVVRSVELRSWSVYENHRIDNMKVQTSWDGINFVDVGEYDNLGMRPYRDIQKLVVSGIEREAKHVKITMETMKDATALPVSEVYIFGSRLK